MKSDEVMNSEYPVKPRKTPRWHQNHHDADHHAAKAGEGADRIEFYDPTGADAIMVDIKRIASSHKDL